MRNLTSDVFVESVIHEYVRHVVDVIRAFVSC